MGVYGKTENKSIDKIHKRTLGLIYDTEDVKIYEKGANHELFIKIIYTNYSSKFKNQYISLPTIWNFFELKRNRYKLRGNYLLMLPKMIWPTSTMFQRMSFVELDSKQI